VGELLNTLDYYYAVKITRVRTLYCTVPVACTIKGFTFVIYDRNDSMIVMTLASSIKLS